VTSAVPPKKDDEGDVEGFLEDILGFNYRSLRTFRDLVIRPNIVFRSYAEHDRMTYTPSLRLWLGLIGIQLIISVLWGGYGGILVTQMESQSDVSVANIERLLGASIEELSLPYGEAAAFLHPILVGSFTAFSAFLIGAFNRTLTWAARINITFGILTAGSLVGAILQIVILVGNDPTILTWMIFPVVLSYWFFFTRGASGLLATTRVGIIIKGAIFAFVTMALVMIGGIIMSLAAFAYAAMSLG